MSILLSKPSKSSAICRTASPSNKGMEIYDCVASCEAILQPLFFDDDNKTPLEADKARIVAGNRAFWEVLIKIDATLAHDLFNHKMGMMDGLSLLRRRYVADLSFKSLLGAVQKHGLTAAYLFLSVCFKVKTDYRDEDGARIKSPARYFMASFKNPEGCNPLASLSCQIYASNVPKNEDNIRILSEKDKLKQRLEIANL